MPLLFLNLKDGIFSYSMRLKAIIFILFYFFTLSSVSGQDSLTDQEKLYSLQREEMVLNIIKATGIKNDAITAAFLAIPRHKYIPEEYRNFAYSLTPIPLTNKVIIPSPEVLALIFHNAELSKDSKVLLIGQGSDYAVALLSRIAGTVWVSDPAIRITGLNNVRIKKALSWQGWTDQAPFDFIFVHYAVNEIPLVLTKQLKDGGILIFPLITGSGLQTLIMLRKTGEAFSLKDLGDCFFTVSN